MQPRNSQLWRERTILLLSAHCLPPLLPLPPPGGSSPPSETTTKLDSEGTGCKQERIAHRAGKTGLPFPGKRLLEQNCNLGLVRCQQRPFHAPGSRRGLRTGFWLAGLRTAEAAGISGHLQRLGDGGLTGEMMDGASPAGYPARVNPSSTRQQADHQSPPNPQAGSTGPTMRTNAGVHVLHVQAGECGFSYFPQAPFRGKWARGFLCLLGAIKAPSTHRTKLSYFAVFRALGGVGEHPSPKRDCEDASSLQGQHCHFLQALLKKK